MDTFINIFFIKWFLLGEILLPQGSNEFQTLLLITIDRLSLWGVRNFLIIGLIYIFFFKIMKKINPKKQIAKSPSTKQLKREMKQGIIAAIFAGVMISLVLAVLLKFFPDSILLYHDVNQLGLSYFFFSLVLILLLNEVYFYTAHRFLHTDFMYKKVHYIHHQSIDTNPFTGFSFHPIEAFILYVYPNLFLLLLPLNQHALTFFFFFNYIFVALGHCGWEYIPLFMRKRPFSLIFCNGFHHAMHHKKGNKNYGLYLNLLDYTLNTNYNGYYDELSKFNTKFNKSGLK